MTQTSTEQERAEFEAWRIKRIRSATGRHPSTHTDLELRAMFLGFDHAAGVYTSAHEQHRWEAWQAARAKATPEVTPQMIEAALEAYMPFGAMELALEAALRVSDHFRGVTKMMLPTAQVLEPVEQRQLDIGKAIERACQELPEGAEIQIYLERGAGTVHMTDWDGNEFDHFDEDHDDFACRINAAADDAIAAEQVAAHVKQGGAAS